MAASVELNQDAVLQFLAERDGRARNADLLDHFRGFLNSPEPQRRAQARECFKELVNAVATVRQEPGSGAKYVQLRKKYRNALGSSCDTRPKAEGAKQAAASAAATDPPAATELAVETTPCLQPDPEGRDNGSSNRRDGDSPPEVGNPLEKEAKESVSADTPARLGDTQSDESIALPPSHRQPEKPPPSGSEISQPSPETPGEEGADGGGLAEKSSSRGTAGLPMHEGVEGVEAEEEPGGGSGELQPEDSPPCASPATALGVVQAASNSPRCGRKNFRERMVGSSPQLKRSGLFPRGGSGSSRGGGDSDSASLASSSAEDESGSGTGSVALDPLEHAWMLCASDGRWETLEGLLSCEPALICKRDFITGFTCLHWAAKHGRHELLAMLVNFAHRHRLPVDVNARTSGGYTALHLAAMHGHLEVVKLLVGAYDADVDIRDYSGRKASHYLGRGTAEEVRSLVGALQDDADSGAPNGSGRWRFSKVLTSNLITYKLSHLHHGDEGESGEGSGMPGKGKELSRKTSGSGRIKPRFNKIRFRTQIIHTTPSFCGDAEEEGQEERSFKASFKLRPKSNVFG
ncbi:ankyrin repeat domain-containing protein SOWAHC [Rhineura floridana]|uniref:ankyrin repeat domain-containing protein SOWAHC n=1 Tax=Rhineura floridana TaxID=261503 RepID=UPI002AC8447C|nr:ankyrin repeat domain-containing protein SOWAHC [Rhineura floridana]